MVDLSKYPLANRFLKETEMSLDEALAFFEIKQRSGADANGNDR